MEMGCLEDGHLRGREVGFIHARKMRRPEAEVSGALLVGGVGQR